MDYEVVARELVRALRGKRSQTAVGRRMRRRSNVMHAWERGHRFPSAADFALLVRATGGDLTRAFAAVTKEPSPEALTPHKRAQTARWLRAMAAGRATSELARATTRNRNTVARWLEGSTEPRLPDLLRFIQATTLRLMEFLGQLVDPAELPSVVLAYRDLEAQRRLAYEMPWSHAVLRALELETYAGLARHVPGFIAAQLGVPLAVEQACLEALAGSGQIRKHRGKWRVVRVLAIDTRVDPARNLVLKRHWAKTAFARLEREATPASSLFSYNLFAISEEGLATIAELHRAYYEQVRGVVEACVAPTRVVLMNVQLVPLSGGA